MIFYIYDISFLILFSLFVGIFLWKKKKNLKRDGIMYLYRTQVGIKLINYIGTKYKKTLRVLSFFAVISGYVLMIGMLYFLGKLIYIYLFMPDVVRAIKIPPLTPLIPYLPSLFKIDFLPPFYFTYWIVSIAVIAIFHEFAHGIFAKRYGIDIKTTGFGFLGPFLAAFVEPNEKQLQKKSKFQQITVLSAGTFTNLILALLFFLLLAGFFLFAYAPAGATFNSYATGLVNVSSISMIGNLSFNNPSAEQILESIEEVNLQDELMLGEVLNISEVYVNDQKYYMTIEGIKKQLELNKEQIIFYEDLPAIREGLFGAIVSVDGNLIKTQGDLSSILKTHSPGDEVVILTKDNGELREYKLILGESKTEAGRAMLGIGYGTNSQGGILGIVSEFFNFFKEPATVYDPRYNADLIIFIYNLIWWLALINLSVALVNMWPVALFDGGRMFMLTIWGITGSERVAHICFKIMTYLILGALTLLMVGWALAIF